MAGDQNDGVKHTINVLGDQKDQKKKLDIFFTGTYCDGYPENRLYTIGIKKLKYDEVLKK